MFCCRSFRFLIAPRLIRCDTAPGQGLVFVPQPLYFRRSTYTAPPQQLVYSSRLIRFRQPSHSLEHFALALSFLKTLCRPIAK